MRLGLDNMALFAANTTILFVMASAFLLAGTREPTARYWRSWCIANLMLGCALVIFMFERGMPPFLIATVPNGLLVVGFCLRWRAAREFGGRPANPLAVWGPALLFVLLCSVPMIGGVYPAVFTIVNVILAGLAGATAFEFWRDRADGLPSRYGLVAAYGIMALSFAMRVGQGLYEGTAIGNALPLDGFLQAHLMIAVLHTAGSGAFALSLAFERSSMRLRHAAMHDGLTGLFNRRAFEEILARKLEANRPFAVALLDIDHFKQINDSFGHAVGDTALRACAATCSGELREGDAIARIGGEEFAVILDGVSNAEAVLVVERMRAAVAGMSLECSAKPLALTISAGICHVSDTPGTFDAIMHLADTRLYRAKRGGRNRVVRSAAA